MSVNLSERAAAHMLERVIFFSDAVFAIAITLLVIEIEAPHLASNDPHEALEHLVGLRPSFFGFALSFLVIARFWVSHHNALGHMARYTPRLIWPNFLLLMAVSFTPFATAFLSRNLGYMVPALFYNGLLVLTGAASARVIAIATAPANAQKDMPESLRRDLRLHGGAVIVSALAAFAMAFFSPLFSQVPLAFIPILRRLFLRFVR